MANFAPLNNYSLFILDRLIEKYNLKQPFLDVACGNGYVSKHLAKKGWSGKAIDYSEKAIQIAKKNLINYQKIRLERKSLSEVTGKYKTVLMFDVLEHIDDDLSALKKINSLLQKSGHLVIAGPSNPAEWRWDDDFYGHFRRYSETELKSKLTKAGFQHLVSYDYTYPFFWMLRRIYTEIKKKKLNNLDKEKQTKKSSLVYAWNIPLISTLLNNTSILWLPIYIIQYTFFKEKIQKGNAMLVLAKKGIEQ